MLDLAEQLVALTAQQLARAPVPEHLLDVVRETQRITSHIAHKRQLHFLAKQMRREDDDVLDALRHHLQHNRSDARRETAELHRIEHWRERLLDDGDVAVGELANLFPALDRHYFRQLIRTAREEKLQNLPPKAFRELFQALRQLHSEPADGAPDDHDEDE